MKNLTPAYAKSDRQTLKDLEVPANGLSQSEVAIRLKEYGPNKLPSKEPPTIFQIFLRQFLNPLIYILTAAAVVSIALGDLSDALFIGVVLLLNAMIGTAQEVGAEKSAQALKGMVATKCLVERDNQLCEINAQDLVPGDIVLLESGGKVPADLRLIASQGLEVDESLLTGESLPVSKDHGIILHEQVPLAEQRNMLFTGSILSKGRAKGVVVATALSTELGKIADSISFGEDLRPPLLIRMDDFTKKVALFLLSITLIMAAILLYKGQSWYDVLMFCVALSVSAIPEGLPVALTIALSIASRKMAKKNVIVRKLPAVEALGSCSYIATDKTGTLTVNQLTINQLSLPQSLTFMLTGSGLSLEGEVSPKTVIDRNTQESLLHQLFLPSILCNEATIKHKNEETTALGDAVDLALLVAAHKAGVNPEVVRQEFQLVAEIPFEAENQYALAIHRGRESCLISMKGAVEKVLLRCDKMLTAEGIAALDAKSINQQMIQLAESGNRVLAIASKELSAEHISYEEMEAGDLTFLGLVSMIDPLRSEATQAIQECRKAGIEVAMVTGDHPKTAFAIAKELGLAENLEQVVAGPDLMNVTQENKAKLIKQGRVFARVEPKQKLEIVNHLVDSGEFVAVTGDGANDAPALKFSNVGVAMGKSGTDIAKETADLIITDDRFASIVEGIKEGRIAYNNVRKVIYLLISTGAAEIILFLLSILFNTPLPLTAVQVLWLNLVTNGIQDVGLAFEPGEGNELKQAPRSPSEPVFNQLMLERIILSAATIGIISFIYFYYLTNIGVSEYSARNMTLLLMVLFENVMIGNCRSETKSAFSISPFRNKILLYGTIFAQGIHIAAMYTPGLKNVLGLSPVSLSIWFNSLFIALSVLLVMEIHKKVKIHLRR